MRRSPDGPLGREHWFQQLLVNGKLHQRLGPFDGDKFDAVTDDEEIQEKQKSLNRFSPIDNSILPSQFLSFSPQGPAYKQLTVNRLIKADFEEGGIVQVVRPEGGISPRELRFRWSRVEGTDMYVPIRYEVYRVKTIDNIEQFELASYVKSEWHKVGDYFAPKTMTIAGFDPHRSRQYDLSIEYQILTDSTTSAIITTDLIDWREPLRVLFDKEWARRGGVTPLLKP